MLILLSPSKTLDFSPTPLGDFSQPQALDQSQALIDQLRTMGPDQVADLMKVSDAIATLNVDRYHQWRPPFGLDNAKQALLAFKGDVYKDWPLETYDDDDFAFAQDHLRILSGLYGALRPLDLIQPYRLEMGTKLTNERGANLYAFWGARISEALNEALASLGTDLVVNLASNEYFKSVKLDALKGRVVTPVFKERKGGKERVVAVFAKRARGLMAHDLITRRVTDVDGVRAFNLGGYALDPSQSDDATLTFTRDQPAA